METRKPKTGEDWIKVQSKSRPGRYYMFNRSTGETQWLTETQTKVSNKDIATSPARKGTKVSPPRISAPKPLKTPAQDRLKRLQHDIKIDQAKKQSSSRNNRRSAPEMQGKSKRLSGPKEQQENLSNDKPSTSTPNKSKQKTTQSPTKSRTSPTRASKRPHLSFPAPLAVGEVKTLSNVLATPSPAKNARLTESKKNNNTSSTANPTNTVDEDFEMSPCDASTSTQAQLNIPQVTSTLHSISTGIVSKIKEICKLPFRSTKPQEGKSKTKVTKVSKLLAKPTFKPERKTETKTDGISSAVQLALNELREERRKIVKQNLNNSTDNSTAPRVSSQQSTPKNLSIPCYQRGSANSRLDRLRQSLLLQHPATSSAKATAAITHLATAADPTDNPFTSVFNKSTNSLYHTANNTIEDDSEAMDWQTTIKDETIDISSSESNVSIMKQNETKAVKSPTVKSGGAETMGDIYDTVNENLLRLSAEKKHGSSKNNNKWLKDFYYFVVDTNVLLEHLTFIEDLTKLKLCDTKGSMLYIPYGVLQELDKLKMRSGCQEGVKTLAVRAIKYLNKKFEHKSQHLLAQTALEERDHFIDVNSADDSIINCCLQVKTHVPNILLLTEDVNLRNKAICNDILVSTKSDLMSKRYGSAADDGSS